MADGSIKIDTEIDTKGIDEGTKGIASKIKGVADKISNFFKNIKNKIVYKIHTKIDTKGIDKGTKGIASKIKGVADKISNSSFSKIGTSINQIGGALGFVKGAISTVTNTVKDLTDAYKVQAKAETQLETAAKNNPFLLSSSVSSLKNYASELQSISTIGDEEIIPFMAQLASAGRTQEEIQDIMKVSVDIAASGSMSLESAVRNLNKTYGGYAGELGETIPQVKALTAEQLKNGEAVKVLGAQYDGMTKEVSKATGTSEQLKNAWGDLKEELGASMEKEMGPIRSFFTELVSGWANAKKAKREYDEAVEGIKRGDKSLANLETVQNNTERQIEIYKKLIQQMKDLKTKYEESIGTENDYSKKWFTGTIFSDMKYNPNSEPVYNEIKATLMDSIKNEIGSDASEFEINFTFNDKDLKEFERNLRALQEQRDKAKDEITDETNKELETQKALEAEQKEIDLQTKKRDILQKITEEREKQLNLLEVQAKAKGESVSAQDKYNVYLQSYIDLLTKTEGLIKEGYPVEQKWNEQLQEAKKAVEEAADAESKLAAAIKLTQEVTETINGIKRDMTTVEVLQKEIDAIETLKAQIQSMSDEEIAAAQAGEEAHLSKAELINGLNEAEKQATLDKVDAITEKETSWWDKHAQKQQEILDLKKEIDESEVLSTAEKYERMTELDEDYKQSKAEQIAELMTQINDYTTQSVGIVNSAANLMLETSKNEATAEQAELEAKYLKGEISEEEYNEKVTESKKKAAKEQYKIQMWQWSASLLQATANIAEGVGNALKLGFPAGLIAGALVGAAGAVQIASIIASKPIPPSFSTGGIIGGSSTHGDNIAANLNSREMVMNMGQQKALWDFINGGGNGGGNGTNIVINNSASNIATAQPKITRDKIEIMIDARVNDSMKKGRYDQSLNLAQQGMSGDYYGI